MPSLEPNVLALSAGSWHESTAPAARPPYFSTDTLTSILHAMSEPSPHSIPLSSPSHPHYRPPPKKKRPLSPTSAQSAQISTLFKKPDRVITVAGPKLKAMPPPPEIVANVQGSSAGAGSGEFHVYKASRRRENERVKMMDDELRKELTLQFAA